MTYYIVVHRHYSLALSAWAAVFAVVYASLVALKATYVRWLGYAHLLLTAAGIGLVLLPQTLLLAGGAHRSDQDVVRSFTVLNVISSVGYLLTLTALACFLALLVGAALGLIRRRTGRRN